MLQHPEPVHIPAQITKFDIAERHVLTAIRMIAGRMDPASTHVVVMACEEMVLSLAEHAGITPAFEYKTYIAADKHKSWRDKIREAYNWFKHADRDPAAFYTGPNFVDLAEINEMQTFANIHTLTRMGFAKTSIATFYTLYCMRKYPGMFRFAEIEAAHPHVPAIRVMLDKHSPETVLLGLERLIRNLDERRPPR